MQVHKNNSIISSFEIILLNICCDRHKLTFSQTYVFEHLVNETRLYKIKDFGLSQVSIFLSFPTRKFNLCLFSLDSAQHDQQNIMVNFSMPLGKLTLKL